MRKDVLLLLTTVSSLLMSASFPAFDFGILAWFGLSPLLYAMRQKGHLTAAGLGLLFGLLFGIISFFWLKNIVPFHNFLILILLFSIYFSVFGLLYRLISRNIGAWIIIGAPALWVALEFIRSNLSFLSFPWNLLGHSQYNYLPVIQLADITGVYGISFIIVTANQFLSQIPDFLLARKELPIHNNTAQPCRKNLAAHILTLSILLSLTFSYGWYSLALSFNNKDLKDFRMALIQANVLIEDRMSINDQMKHFQPYEQLTRKAAVEEPDLIIWPASSLPAPIRSSRLVRYKLKKLANETGVHFLVGGAGHEKLSSKKEGYQPYSNSEFLISPAGRVLDQYNKIRLLPFDEYLPLQGKIIWPDWLTPMKESYMRGKEYTLFQVSGIKFGAPICWENMFPDLFRQFVLNGANFMVSATNEGFFGQNAAPYQTIAMNVFRAVENRRTIARTSSTGISCFINYYGKIVQRIKDSSGKDLFIPGFIVRDMPLSSKTAFYTVYGDIFAYIISVIATLTILVSLFTQKKPQAKGKL